MKRFFTINSKLNLAAIYSILIIFFAVSIPETALSVTLRSTHEDVSLKKEVTRAFNNGFEFLKKHQNPDGSWSSPEFPALTGLVLYAFLKSSEYANVREKPVFIQEGLEFIIKCAKKNGAIYKEALPNYNTSVCIMALMAANDPEYHPYIIRARRYLISLQEDKGKKGATDNSYDGGVGYGTKDHPDLSNTYIALESLKMTEMLESDQHIKAYKELQGMQKTTLNCDAALKFIQRCQNLPEFNNQGWASGDPENRGRFAYYPGNS